MTYTPIIYDWRSTLFPLEQIFFAGGQAIAGGMTLGGISSESPEPGGLGEMRMTFPPFWTGADANLDASWTLSRIRNGAVFRIRLYKTVQMVSSVALNVPEVGQTWANGQPWANDENWRVNPFAFVAAAALPGVTRFVVDMSVLGQILRIGHVIGFHIEGYDFTHKVMDVDYVDGLATVTVETPLRRALAVDDLMLFRPTMLATCRNGNEILASQKNRKFVSFGPARFVEALV